QRFSARISARVCRDRGGVAEVPEVVGSPGWARTSDFLINSPARHASIPAHANLGGRDFSHSRAPHASIDTGRSGGFGTTVDPFLRGARPAARLAARLWGSLGAVLKSVQGRLFCLSGQTPVCGSSPFRRMAVPRRFISLDPAASA